MTTEKLLLKIASSFALSDRECRQLTLRVLADHDHEMIQMAIDQLEYTQYTRDSADFAFQEEKQNHARAEIDLANARSEINRLMARPIEKEETKKQEPGPQDEWDARHAESQQESLGLPRDRSFC